MPQLPIARSHKNPRLIAYNGLCCPVTTVSALSHLPGEKAMQISENTTPLTSQHIGAAPAVCYNSPAIASCNMHKHTDLSGVKERATLWPQNAAFSINPPGQVPNPHQPSVLA